MTSTHAAGRPPAPCIMVIFGAAGDLTRRLLIPALCNLEADGLLPVRFAILGISYQDFTTETFRSWLAAEVKKIGTIPIAPDVWQRVEQRVFYVRGNFGDDDTYPRLKENLTRLSSELQIPSNYFFYLAVAPQFFGPIVRHLGQGGLTREEDGCWRRVIIEKPFGHDLESARALNAEIHQVLEEWQIYRIDHYLGKETVQNILVFRFGNAIFEPIWNRRYIDQVQITAAETMGVETRGRYYETAGALRDMVPNHLFQLLTLTAMEPPSCFDADDVRDEQTKLLRAIQGFSPEEAPNRAVRGQYGQETIDGRGVPAYRSEPNVAPDSVTETYAALKLLIDNWRWAGVPFYLRTGKRLAMRVTEIALQFKRVPFQMFHDSGVESLRTNWLFIHIQPDEGISLRFGAKIPGPRMEQGEVEMDFNYRDYFGSAPTTGYERLLYDCMIGDGTLFRRADMVEAGWKVVTPVLEAWKSARPSDFSNYSAGTWGPAAADALLARDGRAWHKPEV